MSIKYVLLGVLMQKPLHGYKLKTHAYKNIFAGLGIKDGQLYPTLRDMETEGLLRMEVEHHEGSPSRHVYHITEVGRDRFLQWLNSNEGEEVSFKFDFVRKDVFYLRCKFIDCMEKQKAIEKIKRQMATVEQTLGFLKGFRTDLQKKGTNPLRITFAHYITKLQEARLEWLQELLAEAMKYDKFGDCQE